MLNVVSTEPSINANEVYLNQPLTITFDQAIESSSIDYRVLSVHDKTYATVPGTLSVDYTNKGTSSGILNKLIFTPSIYYNSNSKYNVFVHKYPNSVLGINNEYLEDTFSFTFNTGYSTIEYQSDPSNLELLQIDLAKAIAAQDWQTAANIQDIINSYGSGEVPSYTEVFETYPELAVAYTSPKNEQPNVTIPIKFIEIAFNGIPQPSGVAFGDYIEVTYQNVLE